MLLVYILIKNKEIFSVQLLNSRARNLRQDMVMKPSMGNLRQDMVMKPSMGNPVSWLNLGRFVDTHSLLRNIILKSFFLITCFLNQNAHEYIDTKKKTREFGSMKLS